MQRELKIHLFSCADCRLLTEGQAESCSDVLSFCALIKLSHIFRLLDLLLCCLDCLPLFMCQDDLFTFYDNVPTDLLLCSLDCLPPTYAGYFVQLGWWCISDGVHPLLWALHFFTFQLLGACSKCYNPLHKYILFLYAHLTNMLLFW